MRDDRAFDAEWYFEADGDGYIYYPGPHSWGVRVTAAERDVFIAGSTDDWNDILAERERTEPPRPYWPTLINRLAGLPPVLHVMSLISGMLMLREACDGYSGLSTADSYALLVVVACLAGGLLCVFGGALGLWARLRHQGDSAR